MSSVPSRRSMVADTLSLDKSKFTLDTSGVIGIFGGDEAISAMATLHVYRNIRWFGWYNSPGSYQIAKRYGLAAKSKFFETLFPGVRIDPATLFEFDGWKGGKFRAAYSGTVIEETGHLASLFMKECAALIGVDVEGRKTQPIGVTIAKLHHVPPREKLLERVDSSSPLFSVIPIGVSLGACIACGALDDWVSFSLILLGIITGGISCLVISTGVLVFSHPAPAEGSPDGGGILISDKEIVVLQGEEGTINSITRGCFSLRFAADPNHDNIGWCSLLLTIQFIAQLLLVPQGSLFGQIMFVSSLAASWIYSLWLSSVNLEEIQRDVLFNAVLQSPVLVKYTLGTRSMVAIFVLLILKPERPLDILDEFLPNDTKVWRRWKETIKQRLLHKEELVFADADWELDGFAEQERSLLKKLYGDAQIAQIVYHRHIQQVSSHRSLSDKILQ